MLRVDNRKALEVTFSETVMKPVVLSAKAYNKIFFWTDAADGEVSGLGVVREDDHAFHVEDVFLVKQANSGVSTALDPEDVARLRLSVDKEYPNFEGFTFWWHSHVNMDTMWSGTDTQNIDTLLSDIPWLLSTVVNKKRLLRTRLDFWGPNDIKMAVDQLETFVELEGLSEDDRGKLADELKAKEAQPKTYERKSWDSGGYWKGNHNKRKGFSDGAYDSYDGYSGYGGELLPVEDDHLLNGDAWLKRQTPEHRRLISKYAGGKDKPLIIRSRCECCQTKHLHTTWVPTRRAMLCLDCIEDIENNTTTTTEK